MPRLTGPQVRPGVRPQPQESAASVAGPVGGAVLGAAGVAQQLAQDAAERAERARLVAAENEWDRAETALLHDPERGLLTTQREQAFDAPNALPEAWNAHRDRIAANLPPRVAEAFRERNARRFAQAERTVLRHVDTQIGVVEREGYEVAVTNAQSRYADAAVEDADAILSDALGTARAFFRSQGMGKDVEARVAEVASTFVLARVTALVRRGTSASVEQAATVLQNATMTERDKEKATELVQGANQSQVIVREAERILAATDDPVERNKLVAEIPLANRKGVRDLVTAETTAQRNAANASRELSFDRLQRHILNGGSLYDPSVATDRQNVDVSQRETLERYTRAPINDNKEWLDFFAKSPQDIAAMSESEFRAAWSRLNESHRNDAERMRSESKKAVESPDGVAGYLTPQDRITRAMRSVGGLDPFAAMSSANPDQQEAMARFQTAADLALRQERAAKNRPLTPDETQATLDRLRLDTYRTSVPRFRLVPSLFTGRPVIGSETVVQPLFEFSGEAFARGTSTGAVAIPLGRIAVEEQDRVKRILAGNGLTGTPAQIEAYYTVETFGGDVNALLTRWRSR